MCSSRATLLLIVATLCSPAAGGRKKKAAEQVETIPDAKGDMVSLPAKLFKMGTDDTKWNKNQDGEGPSRLANVKPFLIDKTPVTNDQFLTFARETKYKTEAETYGWSFVLASLVPKKIRDDPQTQALPDAKQWLAVMGAWWRKPEGKGSNVKARGDHPVVHIGYNDAAEYCKWANKRLPTETEWEFAARGGLDGKQYPWGDEAMKDGSWMMNVWQGKFFDENTEEDGYWGTAPVNAYPANGFGVSSLLGNVWEWTQTTFADARPLKRGEENEKMVLRGGSFVDSVDGSFNHKTRVTTRMGNTKDSGSHNTGFRCARDGALGAPKQDKTRGVGGKAAVSDPERVQEIIAEKGVEGLEEFMKDVGMGGSVMKPDEVQKKQAQSRKEREEVERYYKEMEYRQDPDKFIREQKEAERRAKEKKCEENPAECQKEDEDEMDD